MTSSLSPGLVSSAVERGLAQYGFTRYESGRNWWYLCPQLVGHCGLLAQCLNVQVADGRTQGNRQSAIALEVEGLPRMYMRHNRRGGWLRWLVADLYAGIQPRPLNELLVTLRARQRGIAVAEPLGAAVEWIAPGLYRGWFITRALTGMTLLEYLSGQDEAALRRAALERTRNTIEHMHAQGLFHADLNLHNLMLVTDKVSLRVVVIDLDKARLYDQPLGAHLRHANWRRLWRSAGKLAARAHLTPEEFGLLRPRSG